MAGRITVAYETLTKEERNEYAKKTRRERQTPSRLAIQIIMRYYNGQSNELLIKSLKSLGFYLNDDQIRKIYFENIAG